MPQKSNHDIKEKYPYIQVGKPEPMRITSYQNQFFAVRYRLE